MPDLDKVRAEVFSLYHQQRYDAVLVVAHKVADEFPASSSYWIDCLLAVQDHPQEALDALQEGLDQGAWWPPLMLQRDPDLQSIRPHKAFARIQSESERRWRQAFRAEPEIVIRTPRKSASGTLLIALHGSPGEPAHTFADHWNAALDTGAIVAVPQSTQPHGPEGGWTWADPSRTERDLLLTYDTVTNEHVIDPGKIVLAGFSQGGRVAISGALRQKPVPARGFIAVAPAIRDHPIDDELRDASPLQGVLVVGENDWVLPSVERLHAAAKEHAGTQER